MKILYLESKKKPNLAEERINLELDFSKIPKKLLLVYSIQYKSIAEAIKKQLERRGFELTGFQQVLGCSKVKSQVPILLIGSGRFHAVNLAVQNNVAIYIVSNNQLSKIEENEINALKMKKQGAYSKFLNANNLGLLVTTKPGQENLKRANLLKETIEKKYPAKKVFLFLSNNISLDQFENFQIDFWINTACPGLFYDSTKIINLDDISDFLK